MRGAWCGCVAVLTWTLQSQTLPISLSGGETKPFTLLFAQRFSSDRCDIRTYETGEFGGFGTGAESIDIVQQKYAIKTGHNNKPAKTLKVIVWCRGYSPVLIDEPKLTESTYTAEVAPSPLANVRLHGKILPATLGRSLAGFEVQVYYQAFFGCEFFNLPDCGVPQFDVGSTTVDPNNEFTMTLPAVADDPTIRRFQLAGNFIVRAEERTAPYTTYWLETSDALFGGMHPVIRYQEPVIFRPVIR